MPDRAQDFLPLRPVDFLVLLMLAPKERHGYGIMQDVFEHTDGHLELEAGSLYRPSAARRPGTARGTGRRPAADADDERRRYYRLTAFGRKVVTAEATRLRSLVRLAESARVLEPSRSRA
jgi:DNA-binding PadR family transcriptional regulator